MGELAAERKLRAVLVNDHKYTLDLARRVHTSLINLQTGLRPHKRKKNGARLEQIELAAEAFTTTSGASRSSDLNRYDKLNCKVKLISADIHFLKTC